MMKHKPLPTQARLHELFYYVGGRLRRKVARRPTKVAAVGTLVGTVCGASTGRTLRRNCMVDGTMYVTTRLIWMYFMGTDPGPLEVDHINKNTLDDNIWNLQLLTQPDNNRKDNRGCYKVKRANGYRWRASIQMNNRVTNLGVYDTEQEAREAYVTALKLAQGDGTGG